MELGYKPRLTMETIRAMEDMSEFTYAQIFDDLLIVAQRETACFVWKTSEGLAVIDAIWPASEAYEAIIAAVTAAGWNPEEINRLILTHGHVDHTGCGKWLVKGHGVKTYLSEIDDRFWKEHPTKPDRPDTWKDFDIDVYVSDGDEIACGDKSVYVCATPGHTPGCLSYFFPVYDNGERHVAGIFGGATPPWNDSEGAGLFAASVERFKLAAGVRGADVMLCNHTAFDNGHERMAYSAKRLSYMPNIYVVGREGFQRFCEVFRTLAVDAAAV